MHESIRNKNFEIVKLLLNNNANYNSPIYAFSINQPQNEPTIQGNCLTEALIQRDEQIFSYLLENYTFLDFDFNLALKLCIQLGINSNENDETFYSKKMISHLLKLKTLSDTEHKVTLKNKTTYKQLITSISSNNMANLSPANHLNFENGLILNWNNLTPKLSILYESWLLTSSRYFITSNRSLRNSNSIDMISSLTARAQTINEDDLDSLEDQSQIAK